MADKGAAAYELLRSMQNYEERKYQASNDGIIYRNRACAGLTILLSLHTPKYAADLIADNIYITSYTMLQVNAVRNFLMINDVYFTEVPPTTLTLFRKRLSVLLDRIEQRHSEWREQESELVA